MGIVRNYTGVSKLNVLRDCETNVLYQYEDLSHGDGGYCSDHEYIKTIGYNLIRKAKHVDPDARFR